VAGAAALVIQAYRQTHGGATPTPALIKQILISTAGDLGAPADEQGAGLLNSYRAVQLAESISTAGRLTAATGSTLLKSSNQLNAVKAPGTKVNFPVTITNTGATQQTVAISGRAIGTDQDVQTGRHAERHVEPAVHELPGPGEQLRNLYLLGGRRHEPA
jgi:subtilisin family serine protease